jgi:hypothetical protein
LVLRADASLDWREVSELTANKDSTRSTDSLEQAVQAIGCDARRMSSSNC